jgi:hypothetical protein
MAPEDGGASEASTECPASPPGGRDDEEAAHACASAPKAQRKLAAMPSPGPLEGVKSKRKPVLTLVGKGHTNMEAALSLGSRASLAGLSEAEAADLVQCLANGRAEGRDDGGLRVERHEHLKVAVMHNFGEADFEAAAAAAPHVLCVMLENLRADKAACSVLRNFKGALLAIEGPHEAREGCGEEAAMLLHALGVSARWSTEAGGLEQVEVPAAPVGEMLGDLRLKDLEKRPDLLELVKEQLR